MRARAARTGSSAMSLSSNDHEEEVGPRVPGSGAQPDPCTSRARGCTHLVESVSKHRKFVAYSKGTRATSCGGQGCVRRTSAEQGCMKIAGGAHVADHTWTKTMINLARRIHLKQKKSELFRQRGTNAMEPACPRKSACQCPRKSCTCERMSGRWTPLLRGVCSIQL